MNILLWGYGILLAIGIIIIFLVFIEDYVLNNKIIDFCCDIIDIFDSYLIDITIFGIFSPFFSLAALAFQESRAERNYLLNTYNVSSIAEIPRDILSNVKAELKVINESYMTQFWFGFKLCGIICGIFLLIVILDGIIEKIINMQFSKREKELDKIKDAYKIAKQSDSPEMKEAAKLLKSALKKIELQKEMESISGALNTIKKIQNSNDYIDVQKELDTLSAMMQLEDIEINALVKKYKT